MSKESLVHDARFEASDDSEDEDFVPDVPTAKTQSTAGSAKRKRPNAQTGADDEDEEVDSEAEEAAVQALSYDSGDEKTMAQADAATRKRKRGAHGDAHAHVEAEEATEAGFVQTRSQRQQDVLQMREARNQVAPSTASAASNVDALWAAMNAPAAPASASAPLTQVATAGQEDDAYVTIERRYRFAGEDHQETKRVLKDSAEGRAHLASLQSVPSAEAASASATAETADPSLPPARGPPRRKRVSKLDQLAASQKATKLNTLEKSRLEWASFVDQEGIADDLKLANRDGYNVKQDFLRASEGRRSDAFKAGQQQAKK